MGILKHISKFFKQINLTGFFFIHWDNNRFMEKTEKKNQAQDRVIGGFLT